MYYSMEDYKNSLLYQMKALEQDYFEAPFYTGCMYEDGNAIPQNIERAYNWFALAVTDPGTRDMAS